MPRIKKSLAIVALTAVVGATGFVAPVMAKETRDARVVRSVPTPKRMSRERTGRVAQVEAMRQASAETNRAKIVPGSDSVGGPDIAQTLAVATGRYGR